MYFSKWRLAGLQDYVLYDYILWHCIKSKTIRIENDQSLQNNRIRKGFDYKMVPRKNFEGDKTVLVCTVEVDMWF